MNILRGKILVPFHSFYLLGFVVKHVFQNYVFLFSPRFGTILQTPALECPFNNSPWCFPSPITKMAIFEF